MRVDRLLIVSILCLGAGLGVIFGYCNGSVGVNAAWPIAGCALHIDTTTTGPGALGGLVLTALGALLLIGATLLAVVGQFRPRAEKTRSSPN